MAIEQEDLTKLVRLLGDLLVPQMREALTQLITVKMEAATQALRGSYDDVQEKVNLLATAHESFVRTTTQELAYFQASVTDQINTERKELSIKLSQTDDAFSTLREQFAETIKSEVDGLNERCKVLDTRIAEVDAAIPEMPEIPAPLELVSDGELTQPMMEAFNVAMRAVITPVLQARDEGYSETLKGTEQRLTELLGASEVKTANAIKTVTELPRLTSADFDTGIGSLRAELNDTAAKMAAEHVDAISKPVLAASTDALQNTVTLTKTLREDVQVIVDKSLGETRVIIREAVDNVPALVGAEVDSIVERVSPVVQEAVDARLEAHDKALDEKLVQHDKTLDEKLALNVENAKEAAKGTVGVHLKTVMDMLLPPAFDNLEKELEESVTKNVTASMEPVVRDAAKRGTDDMLTEARPILEDIARAAGTAAASSLVPDLVDAQIERTAQALDDRFRGSAAAAGVQAVEDRLPDVIKDVTELARTVSGQVGAEAGTVAINDFAEKQFPTATERIKSIVVEAAAVRVGVEIDKRWEGNRVTAERIANEAGTTAGELAAKTAVPDIVSALIEEHIPQIEATVREHVAVTAVSRADEAVTARWEEHKTATEQIALEVGSQAGLSAATKMVPDLVAAHTDDIKALATETATTVAHGHGETMLAAAKQGSDDVMDRAKAAGDALVAQAQQLAAVAATAALADLRADLLLQLDPTERVHTAVDAKIVETTKELGDAISDAMETHLAEQLPRLKIELIGKIQDEVDRIRPEDGKDGKDARVLQPVPYEVDKLYMLGTWVQHESSVWVAARNTKLPPSPDNRDWDCVAPGIKDIMAGILDDGRTLNIVTTLGDGTLHTSSVRLDVPILKGVYNVNTEFAAHDLTTHDGSLWEALKSGKLPQPGTDGSAWKLQVKRGANGKPAPAPAPVLERFRGAWQLERPYRANDIVEHAKVFWLALRDTRERPPYVTMLSDDNWLKLGT